MNELCQYCQSLRFANEKLNCCHSFFTTIVRLSKYSQRVIHRVPHSKLLISEITLEIIIVHLHLPLSEPR